MSSFKKLWNDFWFQPSNVQLLSISLFRMLLGSLLFIFYSLRFLEFETYYGSLGFLPIDKLNIYDLNFNYYILSFVQSLQSESLFFILHIIFLVLLLLLAVGVLPRWATFVTFILHVLFLHRNPLINYGVDFYSVCFLFYLSFIQHSQAFSLKSKFLKIKLKPIDVLSCMGYRLLQVQLVVAYAYAGFEKLKGQTWWEGKAVWNTVINPQVAIFDLTWMSQFPFVIAVLTFLTIIYEVYAPVAFFNSKARKLWIVMGMCFHIGIFITMNIPFFAVLMMIALLIFVKDHELKYFLKLCKFGKSIPQR